MPITNQQKEVKLLNAEIERLKKENDNIRQSLNDLKKSYSEKDEEAWDLHLGNIDLQKQLEKSNKKKYKYKLLVIRLKRLLKKNNIIYPNYSTKSKKENEY